MGKINGKLMMCRTQLDFSNEENAYNIKKLGKVKGRARLEPFIYSCKILYTVSTKVHC